MKKQSTFNKIIIIFSSLFFLFFITSSISSKSVSISNKQITKKYVNKKRSSTHLSVSGRYVVLNKKSMNFNMGG